MDGLPAGQRSFTGDVLHPTAIRNDTLFSHHLIKVAGIELGEAIFLGDMDLKREEKDRNDPKILKNSI